MRTYAFYVLCCRLTLNQLSCNENKPASFYFVVQNAVRLSHIEAVTPRHEQMVSRWCTNHISRVLDDDKFCDRVTFTTVWQAIVTYMYMFHDTIPVMRSVCTCVLSFNRLMFLTDDSCLLTYWRIVIFSCIFLCLILIFILTTTETY